MAEERSNVSVREEIKKLLELQEKDLKLREMIADKEEQPRRLAALRESFQSKSKDLDLAKDELKHKLAEIKKIELEVESKKQEILKHSNQLFQVKTNEEYRALEKEIQLEKAQSSEKEDVILEDMLEVDAIKEKINKLDQEFAKEQGELKTQEKVIEDRVKNLEVQIKLVQDERHNLQVRVREDVLSIYERVLKNKPNSTPVVPVRDYICMGCHMALIHQTFSDAKRCTEVVHCENCSCILYIPEDNS